nr:hypothetical protein [Actinomycetota bacterium]
LLGLSGPAGASEYTKSLAKKVEREVVYVDPRARPRVSQGEAGRIRLRILDKAIGRIKVVVVPERRAVKEGGATGLGTKIGRDLDFRGTLMVVAGSTTFTLTTHPDSSQTAAATQEAFNRNNRKSRGAQILAAVDAIAAVDPGPSADLQRAAGPGAPSVPVGDGSGGAFDDVADDIGDTVKLTTIVIGFVIALPFLIFVFVIVRGLMRRRREQEEDWDFARETLRNELIALGDEIRALDIDSSMPGVNQMGVADYQAAVEHYDRANTALQRAEENPRLRVAEARAALKEGRRRMSDAKVRLGVTPIP